MYTLHSTTETSTNPNPTPSGKIARPALDLIECVRLIMQRRVCLCGYA